MIKEALLYQKKPHEQVQCLLCNHFCVIDNNKRGRCNVRENHHGILYSLVYEKLITEQCDPIEKKPLFHFLPGSTSFSIATVGCNFSCLFCQNAEISQFPRHNTAIPGDPVSVHTIIEHAQEHSCSSISYTYTEPTIFFEYAYDIAQQAARHALKNIFVTNGFMSEAALDMIAPFLHAANVDLKCFNDKTYTDVMGGRLKPVCETIQRMKQRGIWVEVTTLIIPHLNDSDEELSSIAAFLASVSIDIPWHISRFYPCYQYTHTEPTPLDTLHRAYAAGKKAGLRYVYTGNIPGDTGEQSFCHQCGSHIIERYGCSLRKNMLVHGACPQCHTLCAGVWK